MTGDLGRIDEHGLLEIVGRSSRFAKLFGLRIDLARLEQQLAERGVTAMCASDDARLVVAIERPMPPACASWWPTLTSLPARSIDVVGVDHAAAAAERQARLRRRCCARDRLAPAADHASAGTDAIDVDLLEVLGVRALAAGDTFASLGGDSFSYVEASIRIEQMLGYLPEAWHITTIARTRARFSREPRVRWVAAIETNVVLRAFAIVAVVCTHMRVARIPAGAHILLAVVGFNYARFQLPRLPASPTHVRRRAPRRWSRSSASRRSRRRGSPRRCW